MKNLMILGVAIFALVVSTNAWAIMIDNPPPAFPVPPSPWHTLANEPVITYTFKTSWDGIGWTQEKKAVVYDAISYLDRCLPNQVFEESGDFTIRWAGSDFFKDWRDSGQYSAAGWDLTGALAVAYKHGNGPWDPVKYPNNEIYFNTCPPWSFSLFGVDPNGYDYWTVLLHEIIHMLACDAHAVHPEEVMYPSIGKGQRKSIQQTDLDILMNSGYTTTAPPPIIPEPGTIILIGGALIGFVGVVRRRLC